MLWCVVSLGIFIRCLCFDSPNRLVKIRHNFKKYSVIALIKTSNKIFLVKTLILITVDMLSKGRIKHNLSYKLRCYTGISGPEKSRNNTREKISYFFTCVDIANQLLTRHSPLTPLGQVDE